MKREGGWEVEGESRGGDFMQRGEGGKGRDGGGGEEGTPRGAGTRGLGSGKVGNPPEADKPCPKNGFSSLPSLLLGGFAGNLGLGEFS